MSNELGIGAGRQRLIRCPEGHVFDASAAICPTCGAATAAAPNPPPARVGPASRPPRKVVALAVGGALLLVLMIFIAVRGASDGADKTPALADEAARAPDVVVAAPAKTADAVVAPAARAERWRTVMVIAGRSYECINETTPDGRYRLGSGCPPPFAGETGVTVVNPDGSWTSRSDAGRADSGTIEALDADRFIAHTKGGPILWERVASGQ